MVPHTQNHKPFKTSDKPQVIPRIKVELVQGKPKRQELKRPALALDESKEKEIGVHVITRSMIRAQKWREKRAVEVASKSVYEPKKPVPPKPMASKNSKPPRPSIKGTKEGTQKGGNGVKGNLKSKPNHGTLPEEFWTDMFKSLGLYPKQNSLKQRKGNQPVIARRMKPNQKKIKQAQGNTFKKQFQNTPKQSEKISKEKR